MPGVPICFSYDVISFDQNWHHLYSSSAGAKDLSRSDAQIRVIGSVEPDIYTKMLRNLTKKLKAKLSATARGHSKVKSARLNDAFSEFFELEASPVENQSL